jgi:hypothetical protein
MEFAARRFVANPASDKDDEAMLRRQFETWAANDALFQPLVQNNKLLAEAAPLSKDLAALGEAGIKMLEYLAPQPVPPPGAKPKKLSSKARKAELAEQQAAQAAKDDWLKKENAELERLAQPPRRGNNGGAQSLPADVRLAAFRPVKVLANALSHN